jgi:hypothetical protein
MEKSTILFISINASVRSNHTRYHFRLTFVGCPVTVFEPIALGCADPAVVQFSKIGAGRGY